MSYQLVITDFSGRTWDTIKPSVHEAFQRIGGYLSLEDEPSLVYLGDMLYSKADNYNHCIDILTDAGFTTIVKPLG